MAIAVFDIPISVVVDENGTFKNGLALYVETQGLLENDCWCVALEDGGHVRHYMSNQIRVYKNDTIGIKKDTGNTKP